MLRIKDYGDALDYQREDWPYLAHCPYTDEPYFTDAMILGYETKTEAAAFLRAIRHLIPANTVPHVGGDVNDYAPVNRQWAVELTIADGPNTSTTTCVAHVADLVPTLHMCGWRPTNPKPPFEW